MILRRFMQHVKEQNWFAVGLDVVVVIVGIFLGMQVQQWYEDRTEKERIVAQLDSFRNELMLSLTELNTRRDYYQDRVNGVTELRDRLENDTDFPADDFNRLLVSSIRGSSLNISFRGYDELTTTGAMSKVANENLRDLIHQWDITLTTIENMDESIESVRNGHIIPAVIQSSGFGNAVQSDERYQALTKTKRFEYDIEAIKADRTFDGTLALRHVQAQQQLTFLGDFIDKTNELIVALGDEVVK